MNFSINVVYARRVLRSTGWLSNHSSNNTASMTFLRTRRLLLDLLAKAVAQRDRIGLRLGGPSEDELTAGGRVGAAEDPHLEPAAALADARQIRWGCFRDVMQAS